MHEKTRTEEQLSPLLREACAAAPTVLDPSPLLWRRVRKTLVRSGLLQSWNSRLRWGGLAAGLALVSFVAGLTVGLGSVDSRPSPAPHMPPSTPRAAAELVQGTGTNHAGALKELALSLQDATASEVGTALEVVSAAERAQSEARQLLLVGGRGRTEGRDTEERTPQTLIWF